MIAPQGQPVAPPQMPALMPPVATPVPAPPPVTHDVTVVTTKKLSQARVLGVPPEEFGIERAARDIRTCNYCFHEVVTKTESQLIAEGFDEEQVKGLTEYTGMTEIETISRDTVDEHLFAGGDSINPAARLVKITEHYVRMDYQGNGRPSLYQVITGGDQGAILKKDGKECITPYDAIPFAATTPVPVTHRFFGRSMADLVMSIQREKTALKRGILDNMYLANAPRPEISESHASANTIDDLLVHRAGAPIRTKMPGGLNWQVVPNISAGVFPMLQYLDADLASRTGVDKQSQGIDANALQNQSATAVAQVFSASQMRMKLIARIMAEGVRDIFSTLHATIRKHGQQAQTVRLRGQWVDIDPRGWKTRNDMTINVGLGTGGKAQQFAQTMALGNVQKEMVAAGKTNLVDDQKLYNTASELTKIMGHKNPDQFFNDPSEKGPDGQLLHPPTPPAPDPKAQAVVAKGQVDAQAAQQKAQLDQAQAAHDAQLAEQKQQSDALHQQFKVQADIEMAKVKAELDGRLALIEAQLKEQADLRQGELHKQKMDHAEQLHQHTMAGKQFDHAAKSDEVRQKGETETGVHATTKAVTDLHQALVQHAKNLEDHASAPVVIVRGPDGKATGVQKGNRTMTVHRGKDGRPEKLQ